jgi:type I restriction enzyme M protein
MPNDTPQIVQRLWNYCDVLRDDGVSYGDYVEQLTYLLFLKMDQERRQIGKPSSIPEAYRWERLLKDEDGNKLKGDPLEEQYRKTLQELQKEGGMIAIIFRKALATGQFLEIGFETDSQGKSISHTSS